MESSPIAAFAQLIAPETYNLASAILDKDASKRALIWRSDNGLRRTLTYGELRSESLRLASSLYDLGLRQGDRVLVLMPRRPETYAIYLAILSLGAVVLPGSELLMPADIAYRLRHAEAKGVIAHASLADRAEAALHDVPSAKLRVVVEAPREGWLSYEDLVRSAPNEWEVTPTRRDDLAFLSYTSGTTGYPKGVMHVHGWAHAHWHIAAKRWLGIEPTDVVWATAGPGWAKWIWSPFVATLMSGATGFHYGGRFDAETFLRLIDEEQVNVLCATPTEYRLMAKVDGLERFRLSSLRQAVSAGEPLNREVIDTFRRYFHVNVRDGYGQTENTLLVATCVDTELRPGSMGRPTVEGAVEIVDEEGRPLGPGQVGDIAVRRDFPALFRGYYKDVERTEAQYRGPWYITGDRAEKDEDGYLWFSGRADDIIISAGYTIGPFEVEDALVKHPAVRECAAVASPDEVRGAIVKAFVVLKDAELHRLVATDEARREALVSELQQHVKQITAPYKYPRAIEFVEDLPKTASGKIRRVELREREWKGSRPSRHGGQGG
ncbi:acyl-CoA synthetase [Alicyclobacillus vulcanalis]|uniref:Acetyl-CoA synthetase n=1 Tax=Alicyclobacillus vulcanalis TaxID=252246 RepID=A0A1N7MU55_9BACL|nr:AMP-binding protein [Alicyclobacillus vulcanalis]SIS89674.1 acetyl-CoA synthetase [Alicyclobacillus vulcanalis]